MLLASRVAPPPHTQAYLPNKFHVSSPCIYIYVRIYVLPLDVYVHSAHTTYMFIYVHVRRRPFRNRVYLCCIID